VSGQLLPIQLTYSRLKLHRWRCVVPNRSDAKDPSARGNFYMGRGGDLPLIAPAGHCEAPRREAYRQSDRWNLFLSSDLCDRTAVNHLPPNMSRSTRTLLTLLAVNICASAPVKTPSITFTPSSGFKRSPCSRILSKTRCAVAGIQFPDGTCLQARLIVREPSRPPTKRAMGSTNEDLAIDAMLASSRRKHLSRRAAVKALWRGSKSSRAPGNPGFEPNSIIALPAMRR
jgi:hypothetical protein